MQMPDLLHGLEVIIDSIVELLIIGKNDTNKPMDTPTRIISNNGTIKPTAMVTTLPQTTSSTT